MIPLVLAVFTASLLGSTHCVGMCGAFVAFAVTGVGGELGDEPKKSRGPSRAILNLAYNLGRLLTYVVLGTIAGTIGAMLDLGGAMVGVQRAAAIGAGAMIVGFGLVAILRQMGVRVPRLPLPAFMTALARKAHARAFDLSPIARAGTIGLLTTLLPCGWLYAFVITAAGTAHPLYGAVTMLAFWLGTLPILAAFGFGVQSLAGPLRRHLTLVTSLVLVGVGLYTLTGRLTAPALAMGAPVPLSIDDATKNIGAHAETAQKSCPLCHPAH